MAIVAEVNTPDIISESNSEQENATFPCFCCGICCSKYQAYLESGEAQKIADHLGVSLQKFLDDSGDPRWPGTDTHLLRHKDGKCIFLEQKDGSALSICWIQTFKPIACRQWAASLNKKECRQGLSCYWRLSVDDSGKITGSSEDLQCFDAFLKTLK
jgi:Fe-S-cluster containining protein